jgi:hypothetical protein
VLTASALQAQTPTPSSPSSSSSKHVRKPASARDSSLDGEVNNGVYRNKNLGFACKIPAGWVLRTEEVNARDEEAQSEASTSEQKDSAVAPKSDATGSEQISANGGKVLLAAFSRPPEATAEDVNSSILIAEESTRSYPGLKEAAQYLGPIIEVAKVQGFSVVNEPYEFMVGTKMAGKMLARADLQKSVGTRVMRQSTLVMLAHGYAMSFTFIAGTEGEGEQLIEELSFGLGGKAAK